MEIKYLKKKTLTHAVIHLVSMVKYLKHGLQIKWITGGKWLPRIQLFSESLPLNEFTLMLPSGGSGLMIMKS